VVSRQTGSRISVEVVDDGPGIPKEKHGKVFDPFFTTKHKGKGTGLGLWISYNIMDKMGGTLSFVSEEGKGTTFTVEVPIVTPEKK
jgi:two-component system NtrC family sensor kinase